jgi:hypothetical protein
MDDPSTIDIETRLSTLRASLLERPAPGLDDARRRATTERRRPVQLAAFVAGVAILVAALVVYGVSPAAKSTPSRPGPESALAQRIDKFAEQYAAKDGDPSIAEVLWVATTANAAARIQGDGMQGKGIQGTAPVYLVEIPGAFTLNTMSARACSLAACPVRACESIHTGSVELVTIDRSTFDVRESGLENRLDNLRKLGTVHVDRLRKGPVFPPMPGPESQRPVRCASVFALTAFVALANKGADGTFRATYDIPAQLRSVATVVTVAHLAPAGSTSPTSGSWMFEMGRVGSGAEYIWISRPHSTATCVRRKTLPWSCQQTSLTFPQGNGWSLAAAYYLPLTELYGIDQSGADSQTSKQVVDGLPDDCLTEKVESNGATLKWCITSNGVLASFSAVPQNDGPEFGGSPADGTITSVSASAPESLFALPTPPGPYTGIQAPPSQ